MALPRGTRVGPYEIASSLGAGGMGEVYRAHDARLQRDVALKILPPVFAADPDRLSRFQREAQVLASLNHPHIAAIYGLEESDGVSALVLELVEGETLEERLLRGAIPVDDALSVGKQIALALEVAHDQGIVHRDLKPANIKITPSGAVKVLDFGLAKFYVQSPSRTDAGARGDLTLSPTMATPALMTGAGMILGTAAYMSPEQARGKAADRRSDIWAFGCVLFEMLAGKRLFESGDTVSDAVAAILKTDPDWSALPANVPPNIRTLLRRCLHKDPDRRLPHIGVARIEIDDAGAMPSAPDVPEARQWRHVASWALTAALAAGLVVALAIAAPWRTVPAPPETRVDISTPAGMDPFSLAISPDGSQVAFVASEGGQARLWLRSLRSGTHQQLPGTEGASYPFWSPDSRSLAYFANTRLMRWDLASSSSTALTSTIAVGRGGAWNVDGTILYAPGGSGGLVRISSSGGEATPATTLGAGQISHRFPQFLPDGRRFLFYAQGTPDAAGIYLASLDAPGFKRIASSEGAGVYTSVSPGWLLTVREEGALVAQPFDTNRGEVVGNAITVANRAGFDRTQSTSAVSVSSGGAVIYSAGGIQRQLEWFDRSGRSLGILGAPDETFRGPEISPDGKRVVVERTVQGRTNVWLYDGLRSSKFTYGATPDEYAHWSGDGRAIVFRAGPNRDFFQRSLGAGGAEGDQPLLKPLLKASATQAPNDWSPDGRVVLYIIVAPKTSSDIWMVQLDGDRKPEPFLDSPFTERNVQFSPDGHFVAYQSDESGRFEIYARPFPKGGSQSPISVDGGVAPRWRADGKELYYLAPDGTVMAVPVSVNGQSLEAGAPMRLFRPRILFSGSSPIGVQWQYDVAPDGRFLVNVETGDVGQEPPRLILNWKPGS